MACGILDDGGKVRHSVHDAIERGVIYNVDGPVFDLANILTKFVDLGLSLDEVLSRVRSALWHLAPGVTPSSLSCVRRHVHSPIRRANLVQVLSAWSQWPSSKQGAPIEMSLQYE
jgi:hypothetical protein